MFAFLDILEAARLPLAVFQAGCYQRQKTLAARECLYRLSSSVFVGLLSLIPYRFSEQIFPL